jgi:hypothetical protein
MFARKPALCVRLAHSDQRIGELWREEEVAEELAPNGAKAGVEDAAEKCEVG